MHSKGPWFWQEGFLTVYRLSHGSHGTTIGIAKPLVDDGRETCVVGRAEAQANARLIAAACTSYDRAFGPRAVEAAESDVLRRALKLAKLLERWLMTDAEPSHIDRREDMRIYHLDGGKLGNLLNEARALLALTEELKG